jgi:uncharacterized protein YjbI with pentapeptide repeats
MPALAPRLNSPYNSAFVASHFSMIFTRMDALDHESGDNETPQRGGRRGRPTRKKQARSVDVEKADDFGVMRKVVEDAGAVSTGLWVSYLLLLFYVAIAVGAVTHLDLLLENPVKLPFLGVELPLVAFFFVVPLLLLMVHAYTLVHFVMLGKKSVQFSNALYALFPTVQMAALTEAEDERNRNARSDIRRRLPSNIFVQFLAGSSDVGQGGFGRLLVFIVWMTLIFAPVAVLLELQIQFLPFHNFPLIWEQRVAVFADIVLIWWLWPKVFGDGSGLRNWIGTFWRIILRRKVAGQARIKNVIGIVISITVLWLSTCVAVIPGEWQAFAGSEALYIMLFHGDPDPNTHHPSSLFSNVLVLPSLNVYDVLKVDDPQKVAWRPYLLSLRGRDLRGAIFDRAFLERTDAQSAQLQGASFSFARLQGSKFDEVGLEGADLSNAQLQGASLIRSRLVGAQLSGAGLQGARLQSAKLIGADLETAQLQGVNFRNADLRGANLTSAAIRGTSFASFNGNAARLEGVIFDQATLNTVSWNGVRLWQASFEDSTIINVLGTPTWIQDPEWGPIEYTKLQNDVQISLNIASATEPQRGSVLSRIERIACPMPCVLLSQPPPVVIPWEIAVSTASVGQIAYGKALAAEYKDIICSGDGNSLAILRSLVGMGMPQAAGGMPTMQGFLETGREAKGLAEYVMSKECPVSAQLTDVDKGVLIKVGPLADQLVAASAAGATRAQP